MIRLILSMVIVGLMVINPMTTEALQLLQFGGGLIVIGLGWSLIGPLFIIIGSAFVLLSLV